MDTGNLNLQITSHASSSSSSLSSSLISLSLSPPSLTSCHVHHHGYHHHHHRMLWSWFVLRRILLAQRIHKLGLSKKIHVLHTFCYTNIVQDGAEKWNSQISALYVLCPSFPFRLSEVSPSVPARNTSHSVSLLWLTSSDSYMLTVPWWRHKNLWCHAACSLIKASRSYRDFRAWSPSPREKKGSWLIDWLIDLWDWLIDWLTDLLIDWLIDWSIDRLIDWSIDWLIDWKFNS